MKDIEENGRARKSGSGAGEETLRLIARLPAPEGLEDRVQSRLRGALQSAPNVSVSQPAGRVLAWRESASGTFWERSGWERGGGERGGWERPGWMRGAAAAAIVCVVAGGCWGVYSRVQPSQAAGAIAGPRGTMPGTGAGGFANSNARRTPQTLNGPVVVSPAVVAPVVDKSPASVPGVQAKKKHDRGTATASNPSINPPPAGSDTSQGK